MSHCTNPFKSNLMKPFLIPAVFLVFCSLPDIHAQSSCSPTFAKTLGSALANEGGNSIAIDEDNQWIYVAGYTHDSTLLVKMNADGEILWSRAFDVLRKQPERVAAVILDSDGMIVISGMTDLAAGGKVFLMRYNPEADLILWVNEYKSHSNNYGFTLIEKGPGGSYLMSNNPFSPNDAEIFDIDRNTGSVNPGFSKHYHLGSSQTLNDLVIHGENQNVNIYATGRFTDGSGLINMRTVLLRMDPNSGFTSWIRLGHRPDNVDARLYGSDLVIDQDRIYSTSHGNPTGTDISQDQFFIQKTTLEGDMEWIKQYQIPGPATVSEEIIATGDGFVIMGRNRGPSDIILFKINHTGEVQWARKYDFSENDNTFFTGGAGSQLIMMGDAFYFTAYAEENSRRDLILVKTDLDGKLSEECDIVSSIDITVNTINNAVSYPVAADIFTFSPEVIPLQVNAVSSSLPTENNCISTTNVIVDIEESICMGDVYEGYDQAGTFVDTFPLPNGCDSIRILHLRLLNCDPLVIYNLDACSSYMSNGSNMDYTEFVPEYPEVSTCAAIEAGYLHRTPPQENKHSCTPGLNDTPAMCVSALTGCTYVAGHQASVVIEVTLTPEPSSIFQFTAMEFYEKAPPTYSWVDGGSGPNNYPTRFGIRILKNGTEIYRNPNIPTGTAWSLKEFDFTDDTLFQIEVPTVFRIELLPYCPVGNGATVSAWDLEDIVILGGCVRLPGVAPQISGKVLTAKHQPISQTEIQISRHPLFHVFSSETVDEDGAFAIDDLQTGYSFFLKGYHDGDFMKGVSTYDLLLIQKHLLGIAPFTTLDQFVAADINHDGIVNINDLIHLRKAILGYTSHFHNNTSWRFGVWPQDMDKQDPSEFTETAYIESLGYGPTEINFLGIKVGDLNGDAIRHVISNPLPDRPQPFVLDIADEELTAGELFRLEIKASENIALEGIQFSWKLNGLVLSAIEGGILEIHDDHVSMIEEDLLRLSWAGNQPVYVLKGDVLFTLVMTVEKNTTVADAIHETDEFLDAEIYSGNEAKPVKLDFGNDPETQIKHIGNIGIAPNPFRHKTHLSFEIFNDTDIQIAIYDASGKLAYQLHTFLTPGEYQYDLDSSKMKNATGLLFCRIICGDEVTIRKIVSTQ
jgi:hypothetical protein